MMQGDSRSLTVTILNEDKTVVTADDVSDVEFIFGHLRKTYKEGQVAFDPVSGKWVIPFSQQETFSFQAPGYVNAQVRVKFADGTLEGTSLGRINMDKSMSKEVL